MNRIFRRIHNTLAIAFYFNIQNRKAILASVIGLILATSVIFESSLLLDSQKNAIFNKLANRYAREDIYIRAAYTDINNESLRIDSNFDYYNSRFKESIENSPFNSSIESNIWSARVKLRVLDNNYTKYLEYDYDIVATQLEFFELIEPYLSYNSTLPDPDSYEVIYINYKKAKNWYVTNYLNLSIGDKVYLPNSTSLTITGIVDIEDTNSEVYELLNEYVSYLFHYSIPDKIMFLTYPQNLHTVLQHVPLFRIQQIFPWVKIPPARDNSTYNIILYSRILLDYSIFSANTILNDIKELEELFNEVKLTYEDIDSEFYVYSRLLADLNTHQNIILELTICILLLNQPILGITLFLFFYSLNVIKKPKRTLIGNLKVRGCSRLKLFISLLGELLIYILIALIGGLALSIVFLNIVLRSSDLLVFSGSPLDIYFSIDMIIPFFMITVGITSLLSMISIIKTIRLKIVETFHPVDRETPFWKKYYFDIIFLIMGSSIVILSAISGRITLSTDNPNFLQLFLIIGIPSILFMFFGFLLFITRVFPIILSLLSQITWRYSNGITGFAIKNIVRRKKLANQILILIFLSITFAVIVASCIHSTTISTKNYYYFKNGSDINITIKNSSVNVTELTDILHNITGVRGVTSLIKTRYVEYPDYYSFIFINPDTFKKGVYYESHLYGLNAPLNSLIDSISDNKSVIISKENMINNEDLHTGNDLSFHFKTNSTHMEYYNLTIVGTYGLWPLMDPVHPKNEICAIGSIGLYNEMVMKGYFQYEENIFLISLNDNINSYKIVDQINAYEYDFPTSFIIKDIDSLIAGEYNITTAYESFLPILNSDFLICMSCIVIGLVMFGFHGYIERSKEIGVEKALGMTKRQIAYSFLLESNLVLISGIIIASIVGIANTELALSFLYSISDMEPNPVIIYPIDFLLRFFIGTIVFGSLCMLLPIYVTIKKDTSRILKAE